MRRFHGHDTRGIDAVPEGPFFEGRFGRMFRGALRVEQSRDFLIGLADGMRSQDRDENPAIPAGFTYLGQFVDHDITFDPTSSLQRFDDPEGLVNFRTPRFDLDSLYGRGPSDDPFLYDQEFENGQSKLLIGPVLEDDLETVASPAEDDLPRNRQGRALIGDPRNDENIFISQLQLTFIKFHNKIVDRVKAEEGLEGGDLFKVAQRITRWHYQWVVVHDFLRRIVGEELIGQLLRPDDDGTPEVRLRFYHPKYRPFMPLEFSVGAYRYGHSQVRGQYVINTTVPRLPIFTPGPLGTERRRDFRGFRPLPPRWTIGWPFFFELDDEPPQASFKIDTKLAGPLFELPGEEGDDNKSLARRNLLRGWRLKLPNGQAVARAMGERPLSRDELGFREPAPLWFYVLKEAELRENGDRLGPVGGRIVAETFLGLLKGDPLSFLNEPNWRPTLPAATEGEFTMADLIRFTVPEQADRDPFS
jgi:hypothetical protein